MFRAHVLIVRKAKIVLYNLWYHHTYRWPSRPQVEKGLLSQPVTGRPPIGVMIPEVVECNFGLLTMSTCARNM